MRDVEAFLLHLRVLARDLNELLVSAHQSIDAGHLAGQRDECGVVVCDRRAHARVGRFNVAAKAAPKIQLPGGVGTENEGWEGLSKNGLVGDARAQEVSLRGARALLRLRKQLADRHAELRARLENPQARDLHWEVLLIGAFDEAIERRIAERAPPMPLDLPMRRHALVAALDPVLLDFGAGRNEIGSHSAAAERQTQPKRGIAEKAGKDAPRRALCLSTFAHNALRCLIEHARRKRQPLRRDAQALTQRISQARDSLLR